MTELADPGAMVSVAAVSEQQRVRARAYLVRKGHADLLPILGLAPKVAPTGWKAVPCPTCAAPVGSKCRKDAGGMMPRPHVSRARLADPESSTTRRNR